MTGQPQVTLNLRWLEQTGTPETTRSHLDSLERLAATEAIDDYEVEVWGGELPETGPAARTTAAWEIRDRLDEFQAWAADAGVSLDRFYETRTIDSALTDASVTVPSLPIAAMAEYEDGGVVAVTPHETAGGVVSVSDRLDSLGVATPVERAARARPAGDD